MSLPIGNDEILGRGAQSVARVEGFLDGARRLERHDARRKPVGRVRHPPVGAEPSTMIRTKHGSPDRPLDVLTLRQLSRDVDDLIVVLEASPGVRGPVHAGLLRIRLEEDDVAPVSVRVGESPRNVRVAADHHRRDAGQRDAVQPVRLRTDRRIRPLERGAIPGVRHTYREVHVVGKEGPTARREAAGNRPVVAAERDRVPLGRVQLEIVTRPGHLRPAWWGQRPPAVASGPRIVDLRAGDGRHAERGADDRRIPLCPPGREKLDHLFRQHVAHGRQRRFVRAVGVLERDEHREDHEKRVFRTPRLRVLS